MGVVYLLLPVIVAQQILLFFFLFKVLRKSNRNADSIDAIHDVLEEGIAFTRGELGPTPFFERPPPRADMH